MRDLHAEQEFSLHHSQGIKMLECYSLISFTEL